MKRTKLDKVLDMTTVNQQKEDLRKEYEKLQQKADEVLKKYPLL